MKRRDVNYIALCKGYCKEIDEIMKSEFIFGEPKYKSRPDFVTKAVIEMLHKEKAKMVKEVIA